MNKPFNTHNCKCKGGANHRHCLNIVDKLAHEKSQPPCVGIRRYRLKTKFAIFNSLFTYKRKQVGDVYI